MKYNVGIIEFLKVVVGIVVIGLVFGIEIFCDEIGVVLLCW